MTEKIHYQLNITVEQKSPFDTPAVQATQGERPFTQWMTSPFVLSSAVSCAYRSMNGVVTAVYRLKLSIAKARAGLVYASVSAMALLALAMTNANATDAVGRGFEVKAADTQLAQRLAKRDAADLPFVYSVSVGMRRDHLNWNIANGNVNIASEVDFAKTTLQQLRLAGEWNVIDAWALRGMFSTGSVNSGTNRDSDYAARDRTQEYARSQSKTGGAVRDLSLALAHKIKLGDFKQGGTLQLTPLLGLSIHQQSLTLYDGNQVMPTHGVLIGLNNSYDAVWQGPWIGMDAAFDFGGDLSLISSVEYHWVNFRAEANWNLRNDLSHPVSFKHVANGHGLSASLGAAYQYSRPLSLHVLLERQQWRTATGYDQTNFSYGGTGYYTLNPVQWESQAVSVGASYQF
ncbi:MAG: hypothetical protein HOP24_11250 [Sideroxydans sp.]|nr:hypothetical protein [Sideroxydans sp.]